MNAAQDAGKNDSEELEALFDSIAAATRDDPEEADGEDLGSGGASPDNVVSEIGQLTRRLHDAMRELGYDRLMEDAAGAMPDARDRLAYVATMTEQAAQRALTAIETAKPIQDKLGSQASELTKGWDKVFSRELSTQDFKALAERTRSFLAEVPSQTDATNAQLTDIMMAQDFQDLTGQVIQKVTKMAQDIEQQLLRLLVANAPPERREAAESMGLLNGPVIRPNGRTDVVTDQKQVDELLESLGF